MGIDAEGFAELLAGYCLEVEPGQEVLVRSTALAAPLLLELQRAILERDAWPLLRVELPGATAGFHRHALDRHLDMNPEVAYAEVKKAHAMLGIQAPENTRALVGHRSRAAGPRGAGAQAAARADDAASAGARRCGRRRPAPSRRA